jgi:hypothetical protein
MNASQKSNKLNHMNGLLHNKVKKIKQFNEVDIPFYIKNIKELLPKGTKFKVDNKDRVYTASYVSYDKNGDYIYISTFPDCILVYLTDKTIIEIIEE